MEHGHSTGELYGRVVDALVQIDEPELQSVRLEELRTELPEAYDPLTHSARVAVLEGPAGTAEVAQFRHGGARMLPFSAAGRR